MESMSVQELESMARQVRRDSLRMVHGAGSGHPGGALGCADFLTALYFNVLRTGEGKFSLSGHGEDLFFLSNGHLSAVWYSVLARRGYFPVSELSSFRMLGSRLQGHPTPVEGLPGVRIASGSLGQGLSVACGAALGKRMRDDKGLVYSLHGDGELQEGQIWEAAMFAAAKGLDNLIATVDYNGVQIDGLVDNVISLGDLHGKWEAFGWEVVEMDGNTMVDVLAGLESARSRTGHGLPVVIIMRTDMGHGVDFMQGDYKWHGKAPNDEQLARALEQLASTSYGDY